MIEALWSKAVDFHGHACPGLAVGVRACEAVKKHPVLGGVAYGKLKCVTENDACGVDAVQCLLGCSLGKGNLLFKNTGKIAYSFFDEESGAGLRLRLDHSAKPEKASREQWQEMLLTLPLDKLFQLSVPKGPAPQPARIFSTVVCEVCGEGAAESKIRLEKGRKVCLDCHNVYDRGW